MKMIAFAAVGLALSASLSSCNKNNVIDPMPQENRPSGVTPGNVTTLDASPVVSVFKKYTLTKDGDATLSYDNDGRLTKVSYSPSKYIDYGYGFNGNVVIKTSYEGGKLVKQESYSLNSNGKCTHSHHKAFSYYNQGTITTEDSYEYEYHTSGVVAGALKQCTNTKTLERWDFVYNSNHGIASIYYINDNGVNDWSVWFNYQSLTDGIDNKYKLNPSVKILDPYLKLFGDFHQIHLTPTEHHYKQGSNTPYASYGYKYTLNADGYPTKRETELNGQIIATRLYDYMVTGINTTNRPN
ncbi:hypothetical protein [Spirosoma gilvum]